MSKYSFDYFIDTSGMAKISLSNAGIIFSREAIELLGYPKKINIGLDRTKGVLGVCAAEENSNIKTFDFVTSDKKKNWIRIQSKQLLVEISKIAKLTLGKDSIPFLASVEEEDGKKFLIVELKKSR
jgi:uncharacterized pyridoxamine 5'-phosphate oxidase family protein